MKRIYLAVPAALGVFALAACGSSGSSGTSGAASTPAASSPAAGTSSSAVTTPSSAAPASGASLPTDAGSVTIGSAQFPENVLLADIYGGAMASKGVKVTKKLNTGERPTYMDALKDGSLGFVPEYTGSILSYLDPKASAKSPADVFTALQTAAAAKGYLVTQYAAAQDSDTITVTKSTASKDNLKTIGDLASKAKSLTLGAPAQFRTRADGVPALKSVYGVTFGRFTVTAAGGAVTVNALKNGSIDAADIFSTDPSILKNNFVSLTDDKSMFAAQNIVPLFAKKVLTQPMKDACDAVSAKLDTKTLAGLVSKVAGGADPDATAKAWLKTAGLS